MRIELIKEFQAFALTQNLSQAARELHMTQSTLGKHMAELEKETGLKLLKRESKRVSLAPAGKHFAQETASIVTSWEECLQECRKIESIGEDELSVSIFLESNTATNVLYKMAADFKNEYPNARMTFSKLVGSTPLQALQQKAYDVVVDFRCGDVSAHFNQLKELGVTVTTICQDPVVVWFRNDNQLSKLEQIDVFDLSHVPIMTSITKAYDYMREATKDLFNVNGLTPFFKPVHFEVDSPASFFLTDFDSKSVLLTGEGMLDAGPLRMRSNLEHRMLNESKHMGTSFFMTRSGDPKTQAFVQFATQWQQQNGPTSF